MIQPLLDSVNMIKKLFSIAIVLLMVVMPADAQRVDTVNVHSNAMDRDIPNLVILPAGYKDAYAMPVVYLLHGHGDNFTQWYKRTQPELPQLATQYGIIIVCPEGERSWYFDSPVNPKSQFETYVSTELVSFIDSHYKTIAHAWARAITGFSMGGHGGLWLGIRHPDVYGSCGALSGGVDFRAFPDNWNIKDQIGEYKDYKEVWDRSTVLSLADKVKPGQRICIDCGVDDFFYPCNVALHEALLKNKVPHDFTVRPGGHSHDYWRNAILYQLLFFTESFKSAASKR